MDYDFYKQEIMGMAGCETETAIRHSRELTRQRLLLEEPERRR
ncbi:hypothetical protein [Erwinia typographi]|nr:hypothetical protein [Erwinia typographi]